jgi:hypothetical protein
MRKDSAKLAAQAFAAGKAYKGAGACYSTGSALWSYSTCIAARHPDGRVALNATIYSVTTSRHQTAARIALAAAGQGIAAEVKAFPVREIFGRSCPVNDLDLLAQA